MSEFLLKPRIRFGQDALAILNELPARNVLLVTDQAMVKFGLADRVRQILHARGIAFQVWDDVVADPGEAGGGGETGEGRSDDDDHGRASQ